MILKIKHKDIWYYNPQCLISGGLMLDEIIMNLFSDTTKQIMKSVESIFFQNEEW